MNLHHPLAALLALTVCLPSGPAHGRNEWLTGHTQNGKTIPISAQALKSPLPPIDDVPANPATARLAASAPATLAGSPVLLDLTMSIPDDAAGDDDGNQQGQPGSAEQDKWERIVQHFSDAIFEMTDGAHKIRRVRIFRKGRFSRGADIVWTEKGHPNVASGVGEPGGRVNMFKIFEKGNGATDKDMLADEVGSGYTMAHEWGHYFYGVYDEYPQKGVATDVAVSPSVMSSQWRAKSDLRWLNFSIRNNGGGDFQNTLFNRQHRIHGASAWETLARDPSRDPRRGSLGRRVFYPELALVAPSGSATPLIDLPNAAARSNLDIIWSDKILFELVIDNSGSMLGTPLANAKTAAKLLVDRTDVGAARVGVVQFSSSAEVVVAVTDITSDAVKTSIKAAIDGISADGNTAIGEGALLGLSEVTGAAAPGDTGVVFLLSDGENTTGAGPLTAIPSYQNAQVPLFTFAFGTGADAATLRTMAAQTGGKFYVSPTSLAEITLAFQDAFSSVTSESLLAQGNFSVADGQISRTAFPVDSGLTALHLSAVAPAGSAAVGLIGPAGARFAADSTTTSGGETVFSFSIPDPQPGKWTLEVEGLNGQPSIDFQIGGSGGPESLALAAYSLEGTEVEFPAPVLVRAKLEGERPVIGATVFATAISPFGATTSFKLTDDGKAPDNTAGDGIYSGYFYYTANGAHEITVQMDNRKKSARFSSKTLANSPDVSGNPIPPERDRKVGEAFVRTARFSVITQGGIFANSVFSLPKGTYATIVGSPELDHAHSGAIQVTLGARGAFSGKLTYAGAVYSFRGKLNANGGFAVNLNRGRTLPPLQLSLQVDALNGSDRLTGTLLDGGSTIAFTAIRTAFNRGANRSPAEGSYTFALLPDPDGDPALVPQGTGFGTLKVDPDGGARFVGKLADGSVISGSSHATTLDELPLYASLYKKTGSIFGTLTFADFPGISDFASDLTWMKPARDADALYPAGFETPVAALGSRFTRPAANTRILELSSGTLDIVGGDVPLGSLSRAFDLSLKNKFTFLVAAADSPSLAVSAKTGLLTGSFLHPVTNRRVQLLGAVVQKQDAAAGFFLGRTGSGFFGIGSVDIPQVHVADGLPLTIPDANSAGVSSPLLVNQAGTIAQCRVFLRITHTFIGDIIVTLISPAGTQTVLHNQAGGSSDDLHIAGLELPGVVGQGAAGNWELRISDVVGGDIGTLDAWSLGIVAE